MASRTGPPAATPAVQINLKTFVLRSWEWCLALSDPMHATPFTEELRLRALSEHGLPGSPAGLVSSAALQPFAPPPGPTTCAGGGGGAVPAALPAVEVITPNNL